MDLRHPASDLRFAAALQEARTRRGLSKSALARLAGMDPSYLTRLESGDREPPRVIVMEALGRALALSVVEYNQFLVAAGYTPQAVLQLGGWTPALQAVSDVQGNRRLSPQDRAEFEHIIVAICHRWQGVGVGV
jgi:transcriptional regulator with XRE-family HTH domain